MKRKFSGRGGYSLRTHGNGPTEEEGRVSGVIGTSQSRARNATRARMKGADAARRRAGARRREGAAMATGRARVARVATQFLAEFDSGHTARPV